MTVPSSPSKMKGGKGKKSSSIKSKTKIRKDDDDDESKKSEKKGGFINLEEQSGGVAGATASSAGGSRRIRGKKSTAASSWYTPILSFFTNLGQGNDITSLHHSCRYGIRHWIRIASNSQKFQCLFAFSPWIATVILMMYRHHKGASYSLQLQLLEKQLKHDLPNVHVPHVVYDVINKEFKHVNDEDAMKKHPIEKEDEEGEDEQPEPELGEEPEAPPFDPNMNLSDEEWFDLREKVSHYSTGNKILLAWPTIPVSYKGSDSRAVDAVRFLTSAGFNVDLIYWRDFAAEIHDDEHDDTPERDRLYDAGVNRILGPYDVTKLSESHVFVSRYHGMIYWLWPHLEFLDALLDFVSHVKTMNGRTKCIAVLDDVGVALRLLRGASLRKGEGGGEDESRRILDMEDFIMSKRPKELLGMEARWSITAEKEKGQKQQQQQHHHGGVKLAEEDFEEGKLRYAEQLLHQEMMLYVLSDVVVGINEDTKRFLAKMVPGVPAYQLSYVSPVQPPLPSELPPGSDNSFWIPPFDQRAGYIFFGYNNYANNRGMDWFVTYILDKLPPHHKLHVVGTVWIPRVCDCEGSEHMICHSKHPQVECHGALTDEDLDYLIRSVRVAINPILEPSGIATKTCRSLALGTPVVVTNMDGTFDTQNDRISNSARVCNVLDVQCFVDEMMVLLENQSEWKTASNSAPQFITQYFGAGKYMRDWITILEEVAKHRVEVIIRGSAKYEGESLPSQNWHMAKALSTMEEFQVTVMGEILDPPIEDVLRVNPPALPQPKKRSLLSYLIGENANNKDEEDDILPEELSPFLTGVQADVVIRQGWPPNHESLPLSYCAAGCRVVNIVPWEFGYLPEVWRNDLLHNSDVVWAPSNYNRRILEKSGFHESRTDVVPPGILCDEVKPPEALGQPMGQPITFVYTGGLLPRKGIDILLEEWEKELCKESNAKLILHTNYELGYSNSEIKSMENIVQSCTNIEWARKSWMERSKHLEMLVKADVYVAPFRSEGFGIPIVEAMAMGLSVIAPIGGTAADDYIHPIYYNPGEEGRPARGQEGTDELPMKMYPVPVREEECTHYPCKARKSNLCVFCKPGQSYCECEKLVDKPSWFELDRVEFRKQLRKAYTDASDLRHSLRARTEVVNAASPYCWEKGLRDVYGSKLTQDVLTNHGHRLLPEFKLPIIGETSQQISWLDGIFNILSAISTMQLIVFLMVCALILGNSGSSAGKRMRRSSNAAGGGSGGVLDGLMKAFRNRFQSNKVK